MQAVLLYFRYMGSFFKFRRLSCRLLNNFETSLIAFDCVSGRVFLFSANRT